ncbi:TIGR00374 family protein [Prauserella sp. PE36]|uniref:Flippase-like domain-containing protein n=1 Tax=Prauserella endophytica TaxID=1592324 RepID=A0ABY2RYZ0_9PSEU|nr:TIGR00374 family protein [Prauserella sp. PE36]TKG66229.1 flippase-like domain-containing protein [Prauserella endophytica]
MRRLVQVGGVAAVLALMAWTLGDRVPQPADVLGALRHADPRWLLVAGLAEFVSMAMFARQQRRLLTAFGVTMPRHRALALAYSRSAISISLPAGSAVSAAYAFREFRAGGADRAAATAVMVLSGLASATGLALLWATGALTSGALHLARAWHTHPALTLTAAVAAIAALGWIAYRLAAAHHSAAQPKRIRRPPRWPWLAAVVTPLADAAATSRTVAPRHWLLALGAAVANWLTDMLCLLAAANAFDIGLGTFELATIYVTVQLVRQIPLTPGGIGVIEVGLLTGLVSAGAAEPAAAAAVLAYRLLSCWLIIPVGVLAWLFLRSHVVGGALLDEIRQPGEGRAGLGEDGLPVAPRRDVGEQQPSGPGAGGQLTRLPAG